MKGFVPTPLATVDEMVARLFIGRAPLPNDSLLDPGCGTGEFIDGVTYDGRKPNAYIDSLSIGLKSGDTVVAGKVTQSQIREIAEAKMADLNANDVDMAMRIIEGSARSMGLEVVEG